MRTPARLLAVATLSAVAFMAGKKTGTDRAQASIEQARIAAFASAIEQSRADTQEALDVAVGQLARETDADAAILRVIVREPFERRGLLP